MNEDGVPALASVAAKNMNTRGRQRNPLRRKGLMEAISNQQGIVSTKVLSDTAILILVAFAAEPEKVLVNGVAVFAKKQKFYPENKGLIDLDRENKGVTVLILQTKELAKKRSAYRRSAKKAVGLITVS